MSEKKSAYSSVIKSELSIIKNLGAEESFEIVQRIAAFLKENKLSLGYASGTTNSLLCAHKIGLTRINPLEYGLLSERNLFPKPYFGILLDNISYQKLNEFLRGNKISKSVLQNNNIEIIYDKRLDRIDHNKKYTYKGLSRLAIQKEFDINSVSTINDFKSFIDDYALKSAFGLKDFWFYEFACNSYKSLSEKYSFLKTDNVYNAILFQEEWMLVVKKITGLSLSEVNIFRRELSKSSWSKYQEFKLLMESIGAQKAIPDSDLIQITQTLYTSLSYLPCKAYIASESYINLISASS